MLGHLDFLFVLAIAVSTTLATSEDLDEASQSQPQYLQYRQLPHVPLQPQLQRGVQLQPIQQHHNPAFNIPAPSPLYTQQTQLGARNTAYDRAEARPAHAQLVYQQQPALEENYPQGFVKPQKLHKKPTNLKSKIDLNQKDKLEEEELEEPDRLSLLLPNSKFDCAGKQTGYYADVGLNCEVFHYCQDNAKHSWICPEGFTFHQVHLICMPASSDNLCEKSAEYHFVNEYLYKPLNQEEHDRKPNVTLRYADRYFPENFYYDNLVGNVDGSNEDYYDNRQNELPQRPIRVHQQPARRPHEYQQAFASNANVQYQPSSSSQVFHSPEEVNISLQQRRPFHFQQQ